jgi:beta-alanine--pyruvate transaminase
MEKAFYDEDMVIRVTGETIAITPPLIAGENEIAEIFDKVGKVIRAVA